MGRANLLAIFVLILSAALIPPSYAQSFTVTSDLGASSSPHVALQLAESNGYTSSVNAQVHLAAGATVNYQFSEIDWGDGSFTRGSAISTAQGET
ncbi:MAG: hypothetical protein KGH65_02740, partial [Candidatus Micrarchaeota archaeon]|nr:hypothetical protein [Candidatus Micrarchaeota archaeon]